MSVSWQTGGNMFKNNFVISIKNNDKYLVENDGVVNIPFYSEYSIYLKNLDSRRCLVSVSIDGNDVLNGNKIVMNGNSNLDLLGYMDGNVVKNKFKFIKMIKDIEEHRGIKPDDGVIRAEVWYEQIYPYSITWTYTPSWTYYETPKYPKMYDGWDVYSTQTGRGNYGKGTSSSMTVSNTANLSESYGDLGITVRGDDAIQEFHHGSIGTLETKSTVLSLKLSGYDSTKEEKLIYTRDKNECETCGKNNKRTNKFCSNCGSRLNI